MIKAPCPICDRVMQGQSTAEWPHWPFCSDRCRLIDLGRWLGGQYRLPTNATEEDTAQGPESENP